MEIIVNDTNIFIDLYSVGLLDALCNLPYDIRTVDFVIDEIHRTEQMQTISELINDGRITVASFTSDEIGEIVDEHTHIRGNLSIPDCAVCYYARKHSATLITGDRQLRKYAEGCTVTVRGILFIFDELVSTGILTPTLAVTKLQSLFAINVRLPKSEIIKRIQLWTNVAKG